MKTYVISNFHDAFSQPHNWLAYRPAGRRNNNLRQTEFLNDNRELYQTRKPCFRKETAPVLFGLKFADNIHYKFKG